MNVSILNVLRKGGQSFAGEYGRPWLFNNSALGYPVTATDETTAVMFTADPRLPAPQEKYIVQGELITVQNTIAGNYNGSATISLTPSKIGTRTQTAVQLVNVDNIRYGVADGGNVILKVLRPGKMDLESWTFNSTTLTAMAQTINQAVTNQDFSVIFGACTSSTQAITYFTNQSGTLYLEVLTDDGYVPIDSAAVTAAGTSQSQTFSFQNGDAISGDSVRVSLDTGAQYHPIGVHTFACAGGSGSGSGSTGDCNGYAYFDGQGYNNTLKTLNWGATCTVGYNLQISTSADFTNTDLIVTDLNTQVKLWAVDYLANGTYYARVANISGQTRYSATLTFVKS